MVRIGLIGCGRIGNVHAAAIAAHPHAELAAVCNRTEGPAAELAGRYGVPAIAQHAGAAPPVVDHYLDRYRQSYAAQLDHFVTSVETGTAPSPSFADGRAALALADAATRSMRTGRAVRLPVGGAQP